MHTKGKALGFTLIEMLVVMAVVMILAGISMPVYHRVRNSAYSALCVANLKAIGNALDIYRNDWGGWMPYILPSNGLQTKDLTYKEARLVPAIRWKYELSFIMGNYSVERRRNKDFCLHKAFFDPVKGKGQGNYFVPKKHFGAKIQKRMPGGSWEDYTTWTNVSANRLGGIQGRVIEEIQPLGYMPYSSWPEPSRAPILGPSKDPTMQRGLGKDTDTVNIEYRHAGHANILFLDTHVVQYAKGDDTLFELFDHKYDPRYSQGSQQMDPKLGIRQKDNP